MQVVVFSKTYCPYCHKAKAALIKAMGTAPFTVLELDTRDPAEEPSSDEIQAALYKITGGQSVPRVFVGGKFIGGGDDTHAKEQSGELKILIEQAEGLSKI
jgi:glutaredoxin 3